MLEDIDQLFHGALERAAGAERDAYLAALFEERPAVEGPLRGLLGAHAELDRREAGGAAQEPEPEPGAAAGTVIGGYELLEVLGEGGFGVVHRARPLEHGLPDVALKLLKPGMDTKAVLARFELERQALSVMKHVGIAGILDAGRAESGRPYFVMEYVEGAQGGSAPSITDYSRELSLRARLELFCRACRAVQHAHERGVIHRDLKPSNILVGETDDVPFVKVIDFGIARLVSEGAGGGQTLTGEGQFVGSPHYMSPEQAGRGREDGKAVIDERTDVFALGRLLFELLTDTKPLERELGSASSPLNMLEAVREGEPVSPRQRAAASGAAVPRDLDAITMKAMALDRWRRYASVDELRLDIERHLAGRPVLATPPSLTEKLFKFARRNRVVLVPAASVVAALSAALFFVSGARTRAVAAQGALARTVDFQGSLLAQMDPRTMGMDLRDTLRARVRPGAERIAAGTVSVDEMLAAFDRLLALVDFTSFARGVLDRNVFDPAEEAIEGELASEPLVQADLFETIATARKDLGMFEEALVPAERSRALRVDLLGDEHEESVDVLALIASLHRQRGAFDEAVPLYEEVRTRRRRALGPGARKTLEIDMSLALVALQQGRLEEAETALEEARTGFEQLPPEERSALPLALNNLGAAYEKQLRFDEALNYYKAALEILQVSDGAESVTALGAEINVARTIGRAGDPAEAEARLRPTIDRLRSARGSDHPTVLAALNSLVQVLYLQQKFVEALGPMQESAEGLRRVRGEAYPTTIRLIANLGTLHLETGNLEEADANLREAVELVRLFLPQDRLTLGAVLIESGRCFAALEQFERAESTLLEGHAILVEVPGAGARAKMACATIADFYRLLHEAEPAAGHEDTAAGWDARAE